MDSNEVIVEGKEYEKKRERVKVIMRVRAKQKYINMYRERERGRKKFEQQKPPSKQACQR